MGIVAWGLGAIPGLFLIPALLIYLFTDSSSEERRFNREAARKALNWQITALIIYVVGFILILALIGILILSAIQLINTIVCIIGAIKTSQGISWDAPYTLEVVK